MLVGGAENPAQISFSLPDLRSFQRGGVSVWLSQGHGRQGSGGPSVSSWGQRAGAPLGVAMAATAIPTPGSGEGHTVIPHSLPSIASPPVMHCLLEVQLTETSLPLELLWAFHFHSNSTVCTMVCNALGIYYWNEVQAFPSPTFNTNFAASGFTRLGYDPEQTLFT